MARVDRLETLGLEETYLHLPHAVDGIDKLEYYVVHELREDGPVSNVRFWSDWDIVALGTNQNRPQVRTVHQINVEQEDLELPEFDGWAKGGAFAFTFTKLQAFRQFILNLASEVPQATYDGRSRSHFVPTSKEEYAICGMPLDLLDSMTFRFRDSDTFRYDFAWSSLNSWRCSFLHLSHWTSRTIAGTLGIGFQSFTSTRIEEIRRSWAAYQQHQASQSGVDPRIMHGESTLLLDHDALSDLAGLFTVRLADYAMR
jgi:hypothetical protein